jgi:hypothetical protein
MRYLVFAMCLLQTLGKTIAGFLHAGNPYWGFKEGGDKAEEMTYFMTTYVSTF